jgi:hypothetical protein
MIPKSPDLNHDRIGPKGNPNRLCRICIILLLTIMAGHELTEIDPLLLL